MRKLIHLLVVLTAVFVSYAMAQEQAVEVLVQPKQNEAIAVEPQPIGMAEQQLQQLQQKQAAEKLKAQQQHLRTLVQFCAPCHGETGISVIDIYPNLAGQKQEYLLKQLSDFKSKARVDVVMTGLVKRLNHDDMRMLAEYYATILDDKIIEPSDVIELPVIITNDDIPVKTGEQNEG